MLFKLSKIGNIFDHIWPRFASTKVKERCCQRFDRRQWFMVCLSFSKRWNPWKKYSPRRKIGTICWVRSFFIEKNLIVFLCVLLPFIFWDVVLLSGDRCFQHFCLLMFKNHQIPAIFGWIRNRFFPTTLPRTFGTVGGKIWRLVYNGQYSDDSCETVVGGLIIIQVISAYSKISLVQVYHRCPVSDWFIHNIEWHSLPT